MDRRLLSPKLMSWIAAGLALNLSFTAGPATAKASDSPRSPPDYCSPLRSFIAALPPHRVVDSALRTGATIPAGLSLYLVTGEEPRVDASYRGYFYARLNDTLVLVTPAKDSIAAFLTC